MQAGVRRAQAAGDAVPHLGRVDPAGGRRADIEVTDEEVQKQFEDQKKQSFPNEKDYQKFLEDLGQTEEDLLFRVKLDVLSNKVRKKIIKGKDEVSDEEIENYYNKNKERFAQPERRDLQRRADARPRPRRTRPRRRSRRARASRTSRRSTRSTRPRRRRAASCPASPRASRRRLSTTRSSPPRRASDRPGQDPVRLVRLRGRQGHARVAAVARGGEGDDPQPAQVAERAEGARQLHQGVPQGLQGRDAVRRRLRRRGLRERAEDEDGHRPASGGSPQVAPPQAGAAGPAGVPQPAPARRSAPRRAARRRAAGLVPDRAGRPLALDEITRRLRRECPWDREQDERSIVPHTVEEAYELADAAHSGDDAKLLDELGDVLFQVYFLSLLLEERERGQPGRGRRPLPREADPPPPARLRRRVGRHGRGRRAQVGRDQARGRARRRALRRRCPRTCPSLSYARKVQRQRRRGRARRRRRSSATLFFHARRASRAALDVDPELALRERRQPVQEGERS